jgi:hypothetical protein
MTTKRPWPILGSELTFQIGNRCHLPGGVWHLRGSGEKPPPSPFVCEWEPMTMVPAQHFETGASVYRHSHTYRRHTQQTQIADTHCRHTQQTHTGTPSDLTEPVSPFRGSTSSHISQASFATLLEDGEESSSLQYVHCIRRHELCIEPIPSGFNAEQRAAGTDSRCLLVKDTLLP